VQRTHAIQATQRVQAKQARHATHSRTATQITVKRLVITPTLPAVTAEPATATLPAVATDPATATLPAAVTDPATATLPATAADPATARLSIAPIEPTTVSSSTDVVASRAESRAETNGSAMGLIMSAPWSKLKVVPFCRVAERRDSDGHRMPCTRQPFSICWA
jgi:hypothetical protein